MKISWRSGLRLLLIAVAVFLLWGRFGTHLRRHQPLTKPPADLAQSMSLNQPGGGVAPDDAYEVYSALYQDPLGEPLGFAVNSTTDIPQVDGSCLKPTTPSEKEMADSFVAANRQSHQWEKKFSIPEGYRLLTTDEASLLQQCRASKAPADARCKDYTRFKTVRLLGMPGFNQAHTAALVSVIKSCGHLCGSGGIFVVEKTAEKTAEKTGATWTRAANTDFTRDCNWMY